MSPISPDLIASYASQIRSEMSVFADFSDDDLIDLDEPNDHGPNYDPVTIDNPIFGYHYVYYPIAFADGVRWLLKLPLPETLTTFDEHASCTLRSEALMLQLLRRETTIPVPDVYHFEETSDNQLSTPFILMQHMPGKPLYDSWFDKSILESELRLRRKQTLKDIANSMIQLEKFSFSQGGTLIFDDDGEINAVGPFRQLDEHAPDKPPICIEVGPFSDPCSFYTTLLHTNHPLALNAHAQRDVVALLETLLSFIPEPQPSRKPSTLTAPNHAFVLTHPDLDIYNIRVDEAGRVTGIFGWRGAAAYPRSLGNERYPAWLTCDWDLSTYAWDEEMESSIFEPVTGWQDSPTALSLYRRMYSSCIWESLNLGKECYECMDMVGKGKATRASCVVEALFISITEYMKAREVLQGVLARIVHVLGEQKTVAALNLTPATLASAAAATVAAGLSNHSYDDKNKSNTNNAIVEEMYCSEVCSILTTGTPEQKKVVVKFLKTGFDKLVARGG
ncbi:hypothetical protein AJ80_08869 [Polytolypa hystricis UAMH7299]|uniref:Uncharacterized protein n=1 Tax=Polytolypa hystricis (strain UAMH7299) TaxID=1447883 RepID=A0A2B7X0K4_POLH7|nr:hypothetical protein AJ80_08869 [Polytolypa hystricis UAMH7299]